MKKTLLFLVALGLSITLLTATPARADHWSFGFYLPGISVGVGFPPAYYYPAPPIYYYPPAHYYGGFYRPWHGYYKGYHGRHHGGYYRGHHRGHHSGYYGGRHGR